MAAWNVISAVLGGLAPLTSPGPLPHEVAAAAAPSRSPLPWMAFSIHAGGKRAYAGAAGTRAASIACRTFGAAGRRVAGGSTEEEGSRGGDAWRLRGAMAPQVLEGDSCARPR